MTIFKISPKSPKDLKNLLTNISGKSLEEQEKILSEQEEKQKEDSESSSEGR